jgi:hypothetical protein
MVPIANDREALLVAQALAFTIECLPVLPDTIRPDSNFEDMQIVLGRFPAGLVEAARDQALKWFQSMYPE